MADKPIAKQPEKQRHVYGSPVYKPTVSVILVCACGKRYLKTRKNQTTCIWCMRI